MTRAHHIPPADFASWPRAKRDEWFAEVNQEISTVGHTLARNGNGAATIRVSAPEPEAAGGFVPAYAKGLLALTGAELLKREFPARDFLMSPLLPSKGLAMIFAERGIGKTWVGLNIAHATAGGGSFLRWRAPCPKRVVYIDGEMPAAMIKDRYAAIVAGADFDAPEDNFRLVAADLQQDGLPDLADPGAQRFYDAEIADADLIVVDNLSTVCRALRENEADSWGPVQAWALRQRAAGKSVLLIHHAGKRAGPGCLDSSPRILSGFPAGFAECGASRFCRGAGRA